MLFQSRYTMHTAQILILQYTKELNGFYSYTVSWVQQLSQTASKDELSLAHSLRKNIHTVHSTTRKNMLGLKHQLNLNFFISNVAIWNPFKKISPIIQ